MPTRDQLLEGDVEPIQAAQPDPEQFDPVNIPELNPFGLTHKELQFAHAYAIWENGERAAQHAGYRGGSSTASKLLTDSRIRGEIQRLMKRQMTLKSERPTGQKASDVINLVEDIAFANPLELLVRGDDGKVRYKRLEDIPDQLKRAIKSVRIDAKSGEVVVELMDRWAALLQLAKFHGLGSKILPGDGRTVAEQQADDDPAPGAKDVTPPPVPAIPLNHENVVRMNGSRIAQAVLGGTATSKP